MMKKLLLLLYITFFSLFSIAQQPQLSAPMVVADGTQYGNLLPKIVYVNNNIPVVSWIQGTNPSSIWVSRYVNNVFTEPIQVTPLDTDVYYNIYEGHNISSSGDTVFIVYAIQPINDSEIYIVRSIDGGITFTNPVKVDHQDSLVPYSPDVAIGSGGNPLVVFELSTSNVEFPLQMVSVSLDGGNTFEMEVSASSLASGEPCECCPADIEAIGDSVFVFYRNNDSNLRDIMVASSNDFGQSFHAVTRLDYSNWITGTCPATAPDGIIVNDSLLAVWVSEGKVKIGTMNYTNLEVGFNARIDSTNTYQYHPSITGKNDTIGVVWHDNRFGGQQTFLSYSVNGASGLINNTLPVSDTSITNFQQYAHVSYFNGVFHVVYKKGIDVIYRSVDISNVTSIKEKTNKIHVFPNPTHSDLTITLPLEDNYIILLQDFHGNTIKNIQLFHSSACTINLQEIKKGVYFLRVLGKSNILPQKIIIN